MKTFQITENIEDHPFYFGQPLEIIGYDKINGLAILKDDNRNKYAASEDELTEIQP